MDFLASFAYISRKPINYYGSQDGFVKFSWKFGGEKTLSDLDHCRVVLRALAHFHAYSTVIQVRDITALTVL